MKTLRMTIAAVAVATLVALGFSGVASAQEIVYNDVSPTQQSNVAAEAVTSAGTLPYTGSNETLPLAEIGVGLLAAGGLAVVMVRRRQAADQS